MSSLAQLQDAHDLANQQLERVRILLLMLSHGRAREVLVESQEDELDHWLLSMVMQAQDVMDDAFAAFRESKEGGDE